MSDYKSIPLDQLTELARNSNPELSASDNSLFDNHTGRFSAHFESHGDTNGHDTALFLASAREIVLELARRIRVIEARNVGEL